jgi:Ca2+-binding RTX toxin-like protein
VVKFAGASGTFTLSANVERLILSLPGANTNGTGNSLVNTITGNAARNILDGKGLKDTLIGRNGSDTYVVDSSKDTVIEASGRAAGILDHVKFTGTTGQTYFLGANVENLTLLGGHREPRHRQQPCQHHRRQWHSQYPQWWVRQ